MHARVGGVRRSAASEWVEQGGRRTRGTICRSASARDSPSRAPLSSTTVVTRAPASLSSSAQGSTNSSWLPVAPPAAPPAPPSPCVPPPPLPPPAMSAHVSEVGRRASSKTRAACSCCCCCSLCCCCCPGCCPTPLSLAPCTARSTPDAGSLSRGGSCRVDSAPREASRQASSSEPSKWVAGEQGVQRAGDSGNHVADNSSMCAPSTPPNPPITRKTLHPLARPHPRPAHTHPG